MLRIFSSPAYCLIGVGLFVGISVYGTSRAYAQDASAASVAELQQRLQDLEAEVRQLKTGRGANPASAETVSLPSADPVAPNAPSSATSANPGADQYVPATANAAVGSPADPSSVPFTGWNEGFFLQSPDRTCQLRITGQLQGDYRGFLDPVDSSSTANSNVAGSPTTGSPDSFLIRRARLGIEATMYSYYEFRLLPDFAGTTVSKSITDAYMNVHYWDAFQFEIGKFKQPFSYEDLIQDRYVPTMERSMMDQLCPQRDEGAMIHGEKLFCGRFDYAVAISNGDPNDSTIDDNNDKDFNGRIVVRPFYDADGCGLLYGLQLGIAGSFGVENDTVGTTSSTPPTITTPATVTWFAYNTSANDVVAANGVRHRISPELVYFYHGLGFAAQYYHQDQNMQRGTNPIVNVPIDGYYVMATYLLTGEQRHEYSEQIAPLRPFDPTAPIASPGAWELVFRADRLEVGHQAFAGAAAVQLASTTSATNQSSNEAFETTTGLNWYLSKWARAQLNWEHANFANPIKIGNMKTALSEEDALYTRFQVIF
jgi:phosphate-selective porin OprO/OprP